MESKLARNLFNLTGRVVVATGANSGIGLGFLTGCAKQGADVVIWDRETSRDAAALAKLRAAGAGRTHSETVDVSHEVAVESAFRSTISMMGRVDCVFVNAGNYVTSPIIPGHEQ